jgi:hypothetical protein
LFEGRTCLPACGWPGILNELLYVLNTNVLNTKEGIVDYSTTPTPNAHPTRDLGLSVPFMMDADLYACASIASSIVPYYDRRFVRTARTSVSAIRRHVGTPICVNGDGWGRGGKCCIFSDGGHCYWVSTAGGVSRTQVEKRERRTKRPGRFCKRRKKAS